MIKFHIITGLNDGGAEAVLFRLVCKDDPSNHHVISMMGEGKYGPLLREIGTQVTCLNMPRGRLTLSGLMLIWRLLRIGKPSVVQTWMYHADFVGGIIARLARVPRVCWGIHHTKLEPDKSTRSTIWIAWLNSRLSVWVPHKIVCCAEKSREVHVSLGYTSETMVVIPNGYDLQLFKRNAHARHRLRLELGVLESDCLLGMVARFDPLKDHANLISALSKLINNGVNVRCVLVGAGLTNDNSVIMGHIVANGLESKVMLLGQRNDIPDLMGALDVHVLSSSAEAFPNVLAEAMACGTPCVTTDVGDAALIVGSAGWVVPAGNPEALSQALATAIKERENLPEVWTNRQIASRDRITSLFCIEKMVDSYNQVWFGKS
jgi:glycosyltransferase involved in cell wall biosynthesis